MRPAIVIAIALGGMFWLTFWPPQLDRTTTDLLILTGIVFGYLLPTVIAVVRKHHNANSICVVNLFLGWTFLGWVIALAMAVSEVRRPPANVPVLGQTPLGGNRPPPNPPVA